MTGYESKRAAARDKLDDDDTQIYQTELTKLLMESYDRGVADALEETKAALAQPAQEPWPKEPFGHMAGGVQPAQEPVAWMSSDKAWMWSDYSKALAAVAHNPRLTLIPLYTTPPQRTEQCNYPDCKCPTENPCLKGLAQPAQEPVAWLHPANPTCVTTDPTAYARGIPLYTTPPQPVQEPVAHLCGPDENGLFGLPTADKACKDCFPVYRQLPQRPWVGLMRGARVEGDTVVIKVQSNNEARLLCSELVNEMGKNT